MDPGSDGNHQHPSPVNHIWGQLLQPVVCGDGSHANSSNSFKYTVFELKVEHNSHKSYSSCHQEMKAPAHSSSCDLLIHVIYGSLLVVLAQDCMWIDVS